MRRDRQSGAVAIELAILLFPLTIILFGTFELGRAFYQYDTIVKAARSAARYMSLQTPGEGMAEGKCLAVAGTTVTADCAPPLLPGLNTNMVTINYPEPDSSCPSGTSKGCGTINLVEVCVNCPESAERFMFVPLANFLVPSITFPPMRAVARRGV
jgi:hypothetical protein